jgi:hypothetical protein
MLEIPSERKLGVGCNTGLSMYVSSYLDGMESMR